MGLKERYAVLMTVPDTLGEDYLQGVLDRIEEDHGIATEFMPIEEIISAGIIEGAADDEDDDGLGEFDDEDVDEV